MEKREILFRGKRVDNGGWVEGNLFIPDLPTAPTQILLGTNVIRINYDVIPETVGQYTGLTDKNGKKIFEGDVVEFGDTLGVINFSIGCYCVRTNKPYWRTQDNPAIDVVFNEYPNEVKVIGNIHDNPELSEVQ